jgi:hypothetical protein
MAPRALPPLSESILACGLVRDDSNWVKLDPRLHGHLRLLLLVVQQPRKLLHPTCRSMQSMAVHVQLHQKQTVHFESQRFDGYRKRKTFPCWTAISSEMESTSFLLHEGIGTQKGFDETVNFNGTQAAGESINHCCQKTG